MLDSCWELVIKNSRRVKNRDRGVSKMLDGKRKNNENSKGNRAKTGRK